MGRAPAVEPTAPHDHNRNADGTHDGAAVRVWRSGQAATTRALPERWIPVLNSRRVDGKERSIEDEHVIVSVGTALHPALTCGIGCSLLRGPLLMDLLAVARRFQGIRTWRLGLLPDAARSAGSRTALRPAGSSSGN